MDKENIKVGFIGGGNMARGICEGMTRKGNDTNNNQNHLTYFIPTGLFKYSQIYISAPSETTLAFWKSKGSHAENNNGKIMEECDIIFLAVKPHILATAVSDVYRTLRNPAKAINKLFVSILAGVTLESLENVQYYEGT